MTFQYTKNEVQANVLYSISLGLAVMNIFVYFLINDIVTSEAKLHEKEILGLQFKNQIDMYRSISENYEIQSEKKAIAKAFDHFAAIGMDGWMLLDGEQVDIPWYDFKTGTTGGYKPMQGDKDCIVIAEGIHMLNPLIFDKIRGAATGIYVAPRTRILTNKDREVRPEQLRVARRLIRDYNTRGHSLRETVERAESVNAGEVNYIRPFKSNAAIHIDSFRDYEP